jgi:hypothetical protein
MSQALNRAAAPRATNKGVSILLRFIMLLVPLVDSR